MTRWTIARVATVCGYAGCTIGEGEPFQLVGDGRKPRCQAHAHGPVDWDQIKAEQEGRFGPPAPGRPTGFTPLSRIPLPFDGKAAALGKEREPGEDDE